MFINDDDNEDDVIDYEYLLYDDVEPLTDNQIRELCVSLGISTAPITEEQIKSILLSLGYNI